MDSSSCQNILIVEDSPASLKMAAHLISRPGREIYLARNATEGLELAKAREYDLFLLDIMMPDISGFDLCTRLKSDPVCNETPVIFLTAIQDEESLIRGFELGAADFVSKPFNPQELNARVATHLKLSLQHRQLKQKVNDLELLNQQLDAFSYSASHDLKAPLFVINSYISAIQERYGQTLDQDGRELITRIITAGQRMTHLIDDLLAFSRSTATLNRGLVNLSDMATAIALELRQEATQRQAEFTIEPGISVIGDASLLHSVMRNLLGNAWKYSMNTENTHIRFGRVPARSATVALGPDETLCFVSDNGAGFDPDQSGKLFQPFKRLHTAREFEGHGLGLATAKRIIDRHGGRIWAEGRVGLGACFWFTLPSIDGAGQPGPSAQE